MGKRSSNSSSKVPGSSKGLSQQADARRRAQRLSMKIARWERNQSDPMKERAGKSRKNWDTSGMKAHLAVLKKIISKPAKG